MFEQLSDTEYQIISLNAPAFTLFWDNQPELAYRVICLTPEKGQEFRLSVSPFPWSYTRQTRVGDRTSLVRALAVDTNSVEPEFKSNSAIDSTGVLSR